MAISQQNLFTFRRFLASMKGFFEPNAPVVNYANLMDLNVQLTSAADIKDTASDIAGLVGQQV